MLIEFHILQDHGPSNMNRNERGEPKTAFYAGTRRLRVSSQCLKRTLRQPRPADRPDAPPGIFEKTVGSSHFGVRTKLLPEKVAEKWREIHGPDAPFVEGIKAAVSVVAKKDGKQDEIKADGRVRTPLAIFLDLHREIDRIVAELNKLLAKGQLESLADESQVFADHLDDAAESVDWEGQAPPKMIAWESVKKHWETVTKALEELDLADHPRGLDASASAEALVPTYELAEGLLKLLRRLQVQSEARAKDLLKALAPEKGRKSKGGAKESLANLLKLTANQPVSAADIALFGRMTTSDAFRDVEAACQVADAISTHAVDVETDYFTAVDDLDTGSGAAHVGESQYASAVFYKYLSVDYGALLRNLGTEIPEAGKKDELLKKLASEAREVAPKTIEGLLRAIMHNVPSGKLNSHAHNQQPSLILVEVKPQCLATNYLTAFHDPARAGERENGAVESVLTDSVQKLLAFARYRDNKMRIPGTRRFLFAFDAQTEDAFSRLRESLTDGQSERRVDDAFFKSLRPSETFEDFVAVIIDAVREGGAT